MINTFTKILITISILVAIVVIVLIFSHSKQNTKSYPKSSTRHPKSSTPVYTQSPSANGLNVCTGKVWTDYCQQALKTVLGEILLNKFGINNDPTRVNCIFNNLIIEYTPDDIRAKTIDEIYKILQSNVNQCVPGSHIFIKPPYIIPNPTPTPADPTKQPCTLTWTPHCVYTLYEILSTQFGIPKGEPIICVLKKVIENYPTPDDLNELTMETFYPVLVQYTKSCNTTIVSKPPTAFA